MDIVTTASFDRHCYTCGADELFGSARVTCAKCSSPLSLRYLGTPDRATFTQAPVSQWSYRELLPITRDEAIVTLGEGATPLITAGKIANQFGLGELRLKIESGNPTGSFKDRQVSVGISHAMELGKDTVAVVSSGNVACAASAYAARAGIRAVMLTHGMAAPNKVMQASVYGGIAVSVDTPSALAVFDLCVAACDELGWYHLSTSGMHEPFNVEGAKTIAYELYHQTGGDLPEWIVMPVGGGGLLGGVWRGLLDLKRLGLIDALPRLVGVQASGCAPLKLAIDNGLSFQESVGTPWPKPYSIAGGIADDILFDGHTALAAIRETNGLAIAVDDDEILAGELELAQSEGVLCEPSCATVIAALRHLPDEARGARACGIITGTGIKDLKVLDGRVRAASRIAPSLDELKKAVANVAQ